ncbi:MAG: flagellar basal body protein [Lachnospiraceae bacterium]|nr:flagellar basal body protein [Lachnospiraceae bacterium]
MANGFGSLYVGSSGLRTSQNGLNVIANNLSNIDTKGYVRQQVIFQDVEYNYFGNASVSDQYTGLGVSIGDVVHARDQFLDKSYRLEAGRAAFYKSQYEATSEVETLLQETGGETFSEAINDLYKAFAEYAKDPSDTVNLNLISQKASLFVSRSQSVYEGLKSYQTNLNTKIKNDVDRINEIGKRIYELNLEVQRVEAGGTETAMTLRDERDALLDELGALGKISYSESFDGIVKVKMEGTDFILESAYYQMGTYRDLETGFVTPYWKQLSEPTAGDYYEVFDTKTIDALNNNDIGEVKSLLLSRGDKYATYRDIINLNSQQYDKGISNSVMLNTEAELDLMIHSLATSINDLLAPNTTADQLSKKTAFPDTFATTGFTARDENGVEHTITASTKVLDEDHTNLGGDGELPPHELFSRTGAERYTPMTYTDKNGATQTIYVYNEEDWSDAATCYSISSISVNKDVVEDSSYIPYKKQNGNIAYDMAEDIYNLWENKDFRLNPSDNTPCSYSEFYTKMVGELASQGSVYRTTSESLQGTVDTIESNRQAVVGVSSDEELTNMIKFQNAYNASSRYINTVAAMIDSLLSSLR